MRKYIFFPLWKIESLERYLENMEQNGYRLEKIKYSYCFYFKVSIPKEMRYYISYKSFRGQSMGSCDYALKSKYNANLIKSKMCFYTMYRTKEQKENLSLLYEFRMDYIKIKLLEKALTGMFIAIMFAITCIAAIVTQSAIKDVVILAVFAGICVCLTTYYFFGYFKQKSKCKTY